MSEKKKIMRSEFYSIGETINGSLDDGIKLLHGLRGEHGGDAQLELTEVGDFDLNWEREETDDEYIQRMAARSVLLVSTQEQEIELMEALMEKYWDKKTGETIEAIKEAGNGQEATPKANPLD